MRTIPAHDDSLTRIGLVALLDRWLDPAVTIGRTRATVCTGNTVSTRTSDRGHPAVRT